MYIRITGDTSKLADVERNGYTGLLVANKHIYLDGIVRKYEQLIYVVNCNLIIFEGVVHATAIEMATIGINVYNLLCLIDLIELEQWNVTFVEMGCFLRAFSSTMEIVHSYFRIMNKNANIIYDNYDNDD